MTYGMSLAENLGGLPSGARFGVPQQYFPSADDAESVSQYLSTQEQLAAEYHQQQQRSPLNRRTDTSTMSGFNPTGNMGNLQQQATQNTTNLEDAYNQYRQALITVFGYTQRGHLNEASRLLLDLSAWLIDNARDLGKILSFFRRLHALKQSGCITGLFRDDPNTLTKHRQLWHEFNICWLSLCQKQKDLTEALLRNGGHRRRQSLQALLPATMLSADSIEKMGQELIRLCDLVEPHGLVDYQMGIWEEEILDSKAHATFPLFSFLTVETNLMPSSSCSSRPMPRFNRHIMEQQFRCSPDDGRRSGSILTCHERSKALREPKKKI